MNTDYRRYTKRHVSKSILSNLSVTSWIIIINILIFIIASLFGFFSSTSCDSGSCKYVALTPKFVLEGKYLWTFLTSMFMHGGFPHLFINMFVLFSLGSFCERVIGRKRFIVFYLVSGIIAGILFVLLASLFGSSLIGAKLFGSINDSAVGASGAIFAIAGLFVVLMPKMRFMIIFLPFFSLPAYVMVPLVLVLTWIVSFASGFGIGNTAHLGGFLAGLGYGWYLRRKYKKKVVMLNRMFR